MNAILEVKGLTGGYNGTTVVRDVSFAINPGEVVALLGPNGAGKTTTLLLTSGLLDPTAGTVHLAGEDITGIRTQKLAKMGMTLVPDNRGIFGQLTVAENLRLASRRGASITQSEIIDLFPKLGEILSRKTALLSGGEQQMLAVAKGLAAGPKVLLIDELSMGLAPIIVESLFAAVQELSTRLGIAILLVEQHVDLALAAAGRGIVINRGRVVHDLDSAELVANRDILQQAYLAGDDIAATDSGELVTVPADTTDN